VTLARVMRRSLENPALPLTSTALAAWLTGGSSSSAGALVSEQRVIGLPAYYRAMAIRSGVEAALPLKVYRRGTRERILQRTVLDYPNPSQKTAFQFRQTMKFNEIAWGNAFARKVRNGAGVVVETWPIHPSRCNVEQVDPTGANPEGKLFLVRDSKGVEHRWTSWEIFHVPFMSPDGIQGVSAFRAFRDSLGSALAAEGAAASLYANGVRLSGIIRAKRKLAEGGADRLKAQFKAKYSGPDRAGEVAVLDEDAEFTPLTIPPEDAQLLQSRQWSVSEIARMVGVMPHMIGDTEKSTSWGTGIEQQFIGWTQTIVYPSTKNYEDLATVELLPGGWTAGSWYAEHSLEGLLKGDSAARAAFYAQAIQWGWMSRNEVRVMENREPAEGLDEFLTPSNMTLISPDGTPVPLSQGGVANAPSSS